MKKKLICCLIVLALCLSVFAGCASTFGEDDLIKAIKNLEVDLRKVTQTPETYSLPNKLGVADGVTDLRGNPAIIYLKWKLEGSYLVSLTDNGDTTTVNVPTSRDSDIPYTLKVTLVNKQGKQYLNSEKDPYTAIFYRVVPSGSGSQGGTGGNGGTGGSGNTGGNTGDGSEKVNTVTLNLASQGYSNKDTVSTITLSGITFTFGAGENSYNNTPTFYDDSARMYMKNTLTVSGANISKIVFTFGSGDPGANAITSDVGTFSTDTWTGTSNAITFIFGANASNGHRRLATVTVTFSD